MLQARLMKRLRALKLASFEKYYEYLFSEEGRCQELPFFVHQVTTNKTDFFREPAHYAHLTGSVLPTLLDNNTYTYQRPLRVWSSACSTGEEPYTLAMVLSEFAETRQLADYSILATDISPAVLQHAARGVYDESKIGPIPISLRRKYLLRSKDKSKKILRICPEIREKITFQWLNLKADRYTLKERMDIIFCRNVIIYFNRNIQEKVLRNLVSYLFPGGYIFMGHSETLNGFRLPLRQVSSTVYCKNEI
jgi:chemotaxis protein methyltransferase CheR